MTDFQVMATTNGKYLIVRWTGWDQDAVRRVKTLSGAHFEQSGRYWRATLNKINCRRLTEEFGDDLTFSSLLEAWIMNNDLLGEFMKLRNEVEELRKLVMAISERLEGNAAENS